MKNPEHAVKGTIFITVQLGVVEEMGCLSCRRFRDLRNVFEKQEELNCPEQLPKFPPSLTLTIATGVQPGLMYGRIRKSL